MSFTRKSIADHLDSYDDEIAQLQESKRETLTDYRAQLAERGLAKAAIKAEVEALKVAMRRRRAIAKKGADEVESADALADEIFVEISSPAPRATRAREIIEEFDPETGEIHDTDSGQRIGRQNGEQRGQAPVQGADGRGEGADDGDQRQGAGASGADRFVGTIEGELDCEDQNGGSRHVGGEARHEITELPEAATNFTGPQSSTVSGGEPSKPSSDDGGAKTDSDATRDPGRSDEQSAYKNTQSEQAANPIPDDDVPAFLKKDRAEINERCEKPLTCKFGHHPQKITCSTCSTAWAISQRKARAA